MKIFLFTFCVILRLECYSEKYKIKGHTRRINTAVHFMYTYLEHLTELGAKY